MDDRQLDIRAVFGPLKRQFALIAAVFVVLLVVAALAILSLRPVYTSTALVQVDPSQKNLLDPTAELPGSASDSGRVEGEVELARSDAVLLRAIRDGDLLNKGSFAPQPSWMASLLDAVGIQDYEAPTGEDLLDEVLNRVERAISVQRRGLTFLVAVDARSTDPEEAAALANLIAKTYIATQLDGKINAVLGSRDVVQSRIVSAGKALSDSEEAIDRFIDQNAAELAAAGGRLDLSELVTQIRSISAEREQLATFLATANTSLESGDWGTLAKSLQSEALEALETRRQDAQRRLESSTTDAPDLRTELRGIEESLRSTAEAAIGDLRTHAEAARANEEDLRTKLYNSDLTSDLNSGQLTELYELQQSARIARSQYDTLLARLKDLDAQAYLQVADSRIVSEAIPPRRPSFPNMGLMLALAASGSLVVAIAAAFVRENLIGGVVSADQMRDLIKVNDVVVVPRQRDLKGAATIPELIKVAPLSVYSEAIRKIRLSIDQVSGVGERQEGGKVVLMTSALPGEGKSTIGLSLARAYAHSGVATLLIDCDLRKPSLHRLLGLTNQRGLLDFLQSTDDAKALASVVFVDQSSHLDVIVGSRRSEGATEELVTGAKFKAMIEVARKSFDVIILDTPPLGPVVDGAYMARFADAVVLVAKWAATSQAEIKSAAATMRASVRPNTPIVTVLNQSAETRRVAGKFADYYSS